MHASKIVAVVLSQSVRQAASEHVLLQVRSNAAACGHQRGCIGALVTDVHISGSAGKPSSHNVSYVGQERAFITPWHKVFITLRQSQLAPTRKNCGVLS